MAQKEKQANAFALSVHQLSVNYDKTPVLWDLSFEVPKGKLVGIIGPNGAGKSTLMKAILGLISPLSGKVEFIGEPIAKVRQKIAYVPQKESVDWQFPITVQELVIMGCYGRLGIGRRPSLLDWQAALNYLDLLGMAAYAKRQINELSGGQQQRIFIARSLMQEADVYLMDEPFAGIDKASETVIIQLLKKMRDQGKTIFVVHHDLNSVKNYFDWALILNMRLIGCGPVEHVFQNENLAKAYGKNYALFDEAFKKSEQKNAGIVC